LAAATAALSLTPTMYLCPDIMNELKVLFYLKLRKYRNYNLYKYKIQASHKIKMIYDERRRVEKWQQVGQSTSTVGPGYYKSQLTSIGSRANLGEL